MYKTLKWTRVTLSLLIFILVTLNFLYFSNGWSAIFPQILKFQFVPSLLGLFTGSAVFFLLITALTLMFGRVYCSTLCPAGTFQDIVSRIAFLFKSKKSRRYKYAAGHDILRYTILAVVMLPLIGGFTLPLALIDPYSSWGRCRVRLSGKGSC